MDNSQFNYDINKVENKKYTYSLEERNKLFEKNENGAYVRLIIPKDEQCNREELNLIGKLPTDYTIDEVVSMKKYAHYIYEHILNPNGVKDIEHTVEVLVKVIEELPKGTEISLRGILGNHFQDYDLNELLEINRNVIRVCSENGINLNFDKYKVQEIGLPYNIPFIKEWFDILYWIKSLSEGENLLQLIGNDFTNELQKYILSRNNHEIVDNKNTQRI